MALWKNMTSSAYYVCTLNEEKISPLKIKKLSRPIYNFFTVHNSIMAWFIYLKITEWNVNKSANSLYVYTPMVESTTFNS